MESPTGAKYKVCAAKYLHVFRCNIVYVLCQLNEAEKKRAVMKLDILKRQQKRFEVTASQLDRRTTKKTVKFNFGYKKPRKSSVT